MRDLQDQVDHLYYQEVSNNLGEVEVERIIVKEGRFHVQIVQKCVLFRMRMKLREEIYFHEFQLILYIFHFLMFIFLYKIKIIRIL